MPSPSFWDFNGWELPNDIFGVWSNAENGGSAIYQTRPIRRFNKEAGRVVEECKLKVTYVPPPQPPSPVAEESEADLLTENGNTNGSEVSRSFNDTHDSSSEARPLTSNLTEEKAAAVQQSDAPRQQLELTKHDANKRGFGSASILFVIGIGLLSIVVGYFLKSS